jgi:hypothetical protein
MVFVDSCGNANLIAGYNYSHPTNSSATSTGQNLVTNGDINNTINKWSGSNPTILGMIGDILGALPWYFGKITELMFGFTFLIDRMAQCFPNLDPISLGVISGVETLLGGVFAWLAFSYIIELITGRPLNE